MHHFLQQFEEKGFYVFHEFISNKETANLRNEIETLMNNEEMKLAGIGKAENFQVNQLQRGDFIQWIDESNAIEPAKIFLSLLHEIVATLNRNFYLGITDIECHYTHYPTGTFYKKHVDRHRQQSHRIVSFVLYLNEKWNVEDGGQLRIYHDDESYNDVIPQEGTLAIFLSEKEHEVLKTNRPRQSITGWMRTRVI
ncbi:MAG: 2OG-Fe(II) oxygenase [Flavobacteriales bacterium]